MYRCKLNYSLSLYSCYMRYAVIHDFFFLMIRRPPRSTRTDTLFPTRRSSDLAMTGLRFMLARRVAQVPGGVPVAAASPSQRPLKRSEEHTSELQSLMRISYAVFCLKKKTNKYDY